MSGLDTANNGTRDTYVTLGMSPPNFDVQYSNGEGECSEAMTIDSRSDKQRRTLMIK